jgi:hypothetical protein
MSATTRILIEGAAGAIEVASQTPVAPRAVAVISHPHPLFGGTMDNKVATTLARAAFEAGAAAYRFNFRGVGKSAGAHDEGRGETADLLTVIAHARAAHPQMPLWLAGFSFGGAVTLSASEQAGAAEMILVAPAFSRLAQWQEGTAGEETPSDKLPASTLIIHGEKDETVVLESSFAWARPRNVPVVVIPDADHFFHLRLHLIRKVTNRWLAAAT